MYIMKHCQIIYVFRFNCRHGDEHQLFCRQGGHDGEKTMELETACTVSGQTTRGIQEES